MAEGGRGHAESRNDDRRLPVISSFQFHFISIINLYMCLYVMFISYFLILVASQWPVRFFWGLGTSEEILSTEHIASKRTWLILGFGCGSQIEPLLQEAGVLPDRRCIQLWGMGRGNHPWRKASVHNQAGGWSGLQASLLEGRLLWINWLTGCAAAPSHITDKRFAHRNNKIVQRTYAEDAWHAACIQYFSSAFHSMIPIPDSGRVHFIAWQVQ